jgi:hypothetical protein
MDILAVQQRFSLLRKQAALLAWRDLVGGTGLCLARLHNAKSARQSSGERILKEMTDK